MGLNLRGLCGFGRTGAPSEYATRNGDGQCFSRHQQRAQLILYIQLLKFVLPTILPLRGYSFHLLDYHDV